MCVDYLHIFAKLDSLDLVTKRKLANTLQLVIVPEHDFVARPLRTATSSNECKDIASKEHFNNSDSSVQLCMQTQSEYQSEIRCCF